MYCYHLGLKDHYWWAMIALLVLRENYIYLEIVDSFETLDNDEAKSVSYANNSHAIFFSQCLTPTHFIGNILATK